MPLSKAERAQEKEEQREARINEARTEVQELMQVLRHFVDQRSVRETAQLMGCNPKKVEAHRRYLRLTRSDASLNMRGLRVRSRAGVDLLLAHGAAD